MNWPWVKPHGANRNRVSPVLIDIGSKRLDLTTELRPFRPRALAPRVAERARRLSTVRAPLGLLDGLRVSLLPGENEQDWDGFGAPVEVMFSAAGEIGFIRTVTPVLQRILAHGEVRFAAENMDVELTALLVEAALAERITVLEENIGGEFNLMRLCPIEKHPGLADLGLSIIHEGANIAYPGIIFASAPLLSALARQWEQRPMIGFDPSPLQFILASRAGYIDLTVSALSMLTIGDAMLFDRVARAGGAAIALQESFHAPAYFDKAGALMLTEAFSRNRNDHNAFGDFLMEQDDDTRPVEALAEASVEDLPVRLIFEIGRMELSLEEVRKLSVGAPLPLPRAQTSAVDILANGRRIGAGEMVMIGDQLGVRVTRLVGHG